MTHVAILYVDIHTFVSNLTHTFGRSLEITAEHRLPTFSYDSLRQPTTAYDSLRQYHCYMFLRSVHKEVQLKVGYARLSLLFGSSRS